MRDISFISRGIDTCFGRHMKKIVRNIILFVISSGVKVLWVFPIKERQIMFNSFRGQFSDSPKYIFECIVSQKKKYDYVWVSKAEGQGIPSNCRTVKGHGIRFFYYLATSKMIITNDFLNTYYPRRKGQTVVNTWHGGSPLKTVGMVGAEVSEEDRDFFRRHDRIYSFFLSSSSFMTNEVFRKSFGYTGKIYETGMPRNAILLRDHTSQERKVREYFGIENDKAIALYAPTFRGSVSEGGFLPPDEQFDIKRCLEALRDRFGKEYCFLFRAHHACKISIDGDNIFSASDYPDMQELLCASDVLITDYSSCMGDEALMKKPVFLYCPDLDSYISERGFYWDIFTLPFPVARSEEEFLSSIAHFDFDKYKNGVDNYLSKLGTFENADADKKAGEMVIRFLEGNEIDEQEVF